jgi:hypothetical protein
MVLFGKAMKDKKFHVLPFTAESLHLFSPKQRLKAWVNHVGARGVSSLWVGRAPLIVWNTRLKVFINRAMGDAAPVSIIRHLSRVNAFGKPGGGY